MILNTSAGPYYEVVGLSSDEVTNTLQQLLLLELAIGGGAVLRGAGSRRRSACG